MFEQLSSKLDDAFRKLSGKAVLSEDNIKEGLRDVRRALLLHASVAPGSDLPSVLRYMSVIKDVERVGDYAKNIYDLAKLGVDFEAAPAHDELASYRDAAAQLLTVQETLALREREYERTRVQLDQRTLRAPMSGIVIEIVKQPGEFVSPVSPVVMNIAQLDPLQAVFSVPTGRISELSLGAPVDVAVGPTTLRGSVEFISPQIEPQTGTRQVRIRLPNPNGKRPSGERCRLRLKRAPQSVAEDHHITY